MYSEQMNQFIGTCFQLKPHHIASEKYKENIFFLQNQPKGIF